MIDWLDKELEQIFYYSNVDTDRHTIKSENINGRLYEKHGIDCAVTIAALVYKVYDPSINHNKYAILVGTARQNPYDTVITTEQGIEIAIENAMIDPVMTIEYSTKVNEDTIYNLMESYASGLPVQFVKTRSEILAEGKDSKVYNRIMNNDYYNQYYQDFKKIFLN